MPGQLGVRKRFITSPQGSTSLPATQTAAIPLTVGVGLTVTGQAEHDAGISLAVATTLTPSLGGGASAMARELAQSGSLILPSIWLTDMTVARTTWSILDPVVGGETAANGDVWKYCGPGSPTGGGGYTPRSLGAYGSYKPTDANTGIVSARSSLPTYNSPGTAKLTISVDNTTFTSLEIFGDIVIKAKNVVFQDCLFRGPYAWPSNDGAIIDCNDAGCYNLLVQDCTFMPQLPNYYRNAIIGHEFTFLRNRVIWCNDSIGVYSKPGLPNATNVKVAGCKTSDNVYWQGTVAAYPGQTVGTITVTPTYASSYTVPGYPLKSDGTHNDSCQIQGGLGGTKSIWVVGNDFHDNDAVQSDPHPLGYSDAIPQLGTQNCYKRFDTSGNPQPMFNGRYPSNGQCVVLQQNTYQFPAVDTAVVELNWLSEFGQGANIQAHSGGFTTIKCTFQGNQFGENMYYFVPANPSTYPIRIDYRSGATVAGINTNTWYEAHWQPIGSTLVEGRTSGIVYDNP